MRRLTERASTVASRLLDRASTRDLADAFDVDPSEVLLAERITTEVAGDTATLTLHYREE